MGSWLVPVKSWKNRGRVYSFGSQGGARGAWSPLFLDQTEAPRAEKKFVETAPLAPPYLKVWLWQWSIWKTLHVNTNYYELRTKSEMPPTVSASHVFSAIQSLSLPARSRSWSPRSCRKQERDRLVRKTTPLPERNELTPSVKETKCNFRRTSPAPIPE